MVFGCQHDHGGSRFHERASLPSGMDLSSEWACIQLNWLKDQNSFGWFGFFSLWDIPLFIRSSIVRTCLHPLIALWTHPGLVPNWFNEVLKNQELERHLCRSNTTSANWCNKMICFLVDLASAANWPSSKIKFIAKWFKGYSSPPHYIVFLFLKIRNLKCSKNSL